MSREPIEIAPATRTWRDISQPVRVRAMSRGGKWRHAVDVVKTAAALAVLAAVGWGAIAVAESTKPGATAGTTPAPRIKPPVLVTDHMLDAAWLERTLQLPKNAALMQLNLEALRDRVLADSQVLAAEVTREFPDKLVVRIEERRPIARAELQGRTVLVAADGVIFAGEGHPAEEVQALQLLRNLEVETPTLAAGTHSRVAGMKPVSELIMTARLEAPHLYRHWSEVSLAHLALDGEIEVRSHVPQVLTAVFKADGKPLAQLARLSLIVEKFAARTDIEELHVDLSLGAQHVPVTWTESKIIPEKSKSRGASAKGLAVAAKTPPATSAPVAPVRPVALPVIGGGAGSGFSATPVSMPASRDTSGIVIPGANPVSASTVGATNRVIALPNLPSKAKREF